LISAEEAARQDRRFTQLGYEFVRYAVREGGHSPNKVELVRRWMRSYLLKPEVERDSMRMPSAFQGLEVATRKAVHPLCPDARSLMKWLEVASGDFYFDRSIAAAWYELIPLWLQFLAMKGIVTPDQRARAQRDLSVIRPHVQKILSGHPLTPLYQENLRRAWGEPNPAAVPAEITETRR
jgi:hypothetical protein